MTGFIMFIHALVCVMLTAAILMQSGRGGGLTEGFASADSMLGAKTNEVMVKATTILTVVFLVTCLSLAVLSSRSGKSVMPDTVAPPVAPPAPALPQSQDATKQQMENLPKQAPQKQAQP